MVAVLVQTQGNTTNGVIRFQPLEGGRVQVSGTVSGLKPNSEHAIHIHQFGDVTAADGTSAGGHFNPEGHPHGLPDAAQKHAGDLGNLKADAKGAATISLTLEGVTVAEGKMAILGRSVVVHENPDDGGQPTGNAGARIAVGVIGWAKP